MKNIYFLILSLISINIKAQPVPGAIDSLPIVNDYYSVSANFPAYTFTDPNTCTNDRINVYARSKVRVTSVMGNQITFIVTQRSNKYDSKAAKKHQTYCIDTTTFKRSVDFMPLANSVKFDWGLLTVPFKFQSINYLVHPGGSLGGFLGARYVPASNSSFGISVGVFGGLSSVPLNNTSITPSTSPADIKVVSGVGAGPLVVLTLSKAFQVGFVMGRDWYNDGSGPKKNNWLSFSIGYTFVQPEPPAKP